MGNHSSKEDDMEEQAQYIPARTNISAIPGDGRQQIYERGGVVVDGGAWTTEGTARDLNVGESYQHTVVGGAEIVTGGGGQYASGMDSDSGGYQQSVSGVYGGGGAEDGNYNRFNRTSGTASTGASDDDDIVPTVFKWENGGRNVYITGTFNNWERQIPMHRSGNEFSYVHSLTRGKHAYKFIVDDEWRFAPDQPTVADVEGRINNFIDVSEFAPYIGDNTFFEKCKDRKVLNSEFNDNIPDVDDYTKEPPSLPPHLRLIILNKLPPSADPLSLPEPQHVSLNHLYCTAIKDGIMVLGATQRYRQKYVTIVFYSLMS